MPRAGQPPRRKPSRSTDGGQTWQSLAGQLPQAVLERSDWPELAVHPQPNGKTVVYAVLGDCWHPHTSGGFNGGRYCQPGIWRSTNGGAMNQTFTNVFPVGVEPPALPASAGEPMNSYNSYTHALAIHPSDPDRFWWGGIGLNVGEMANPNTATFLPNDPIGSAAGKGTHPDVHGMYVWEGDCSWAISGLGCTAPVTNQCAYLVTDGGFHVGDGVNCWNGDIQAGFMTAQFQSVSVDHELTLGGTQDNGTNALETGIVWHHWTDGDSASTVIERNPQSQISPQPTIYEVQTRVSLGSPRFCTVPGAPFACANHFFGGNPDGMVQLNAMNEWEAIERVSFYPPIEQDRGPTNNPLLYFGGFHLWRWVNGHGMT